MSEPNILTKFSWWWDSVKGLCGHIAIYKAMHNLAKTIPPNQQSPALRAQLRNQQTMVGNCLLRVLLVHPVGSDRFW